MVQVPKNFNSLKKQNEKKTALISDDIEQNCHDFVYNS